MLWPAQDPGTAESTSKRKFPPAISRLCRGGLFRRSASRPLSECRSAHLLPPAASPTCLSNPPRGCNKPSVRHISYACGFPAHPSLRDPAHLTDGIPYSERPQFRILLLSTDSSSSILRCGKSQNVHTAPVRKHFFRIPAEDAASRLSYFPAYRIFTLPVSLSHIRSTLSSFRKINSSAAEEFSAALLCVFLRYSIIHSLFRFFHPKLYAPRVAAITALIVCIRFSASSNTLDCADSNTSSVTSISFRP